ncbi:hypothetical protein F4819DRAFT_231597 [Hypoxylon fuscum]|nr:hypothetical protein F4819DRAFT_231597 [Hypoxylon fuscum]
MRLTGFAVAAALPIVFAAQPRVIQSTSVKVEDAPGLMASTPVLVNSTTEITQTPKPLTTAVTEKPALEASVMGLIVFSAAGLYLL